MGVADKSAAKIYGNSRKDNLNEFVSFGFGENIVSNYSATFVPSRSRGHL